MLMKNEQPQKVTVSLTNRTIIRTIFWVVVAVVGYKLFFKVGHILSLVFAAFFLALALNPVVSWVSRRLKVESRARATAAAYGLVISVLIAFFALIIPPLVTQSRDFINEVPKLVENFQKQDSGLARTAKKYNIDQKISTTAKDFADNYGNFGSTVLDTGKRLITIIAESLAVIVMAFMMLVEGPYWMSLIWGFVPKKNRAHAKELAHEMYRGVSGFVNGQVIISLVAGAFVFIALTIASHAVGVSVNAAALAGIVAVFGLIPLFGNPISSTIVLLFCLLSSIHLAAIMAIYFVVYYFIENHTFQPFIQARLNKLTALSVFVSALLGIGLAGFMGAIVAIPVASAVKVIVEDYFKRSSGADLPSTSGITASSVV